MEVKEAITQLEDIIRDRRNFVDDDESAEWNDVWLRDIAALRVAIESLSKQKKYVPFNSHCPNCKRHLRCPRTEHLINGRTKTRLGDKFCPSCGQAIDWW